MQPQFLDDVETTSAGDQGDASEESDNNDDDDDDDDVSLGPPPSLPLVLGDLERLCGFCPSSEQEADQLRDQVVNALSQDEADQSETPEHDSTTGCLGTLTFACRSYLKIVWPFMEIRSWT